MLDFTWKFDKYWPEIQSKFPGSFADFSRKFRWLFRQVPRLGAEADFRNYVASERADKKRKTAKNYLIDKPNKKAAPIKVPSTLALMASMPETSNNTDVVIDIEKSTAVTPPVQVSAPKQIQKKGWVDAKGNSLPTNPIEGKTFVVGNFVEIFSPTELQ